MKILEPEAMPTDSFLCVCGDFDSITRLVPSLVNNAKETEKVR